MKVPKQHRQRKGRQPRKGPHVPDIVDWERYMWLRQGNNAASVAVMYNVTERTVYASAQKVRKYLMTTPGFEGAKQAIQGMVHDALVGLRLCLQRGHYPAIRDVLVSEGLLLNTTGCGDASPYRDKSDVELIAMVLDLANQTGDKGVLMEIQRYATIELKPTEADDSKHPVGAAPAEVRGTYQVLEGDETA